MSAKESKESKTFKVFHAKIEIDMDLKDGETLEEAKNRMRKELKKTDLKYIYTHNASLRECWIMD